MPLEDSFMLTQITVNLADAASVQATLTAQPDDVRARGIDVTFLNVSIPVDMTGEDVIFVWKNDQHPELQGAEPFDAIDAQIGNWKVHYPGKMLVADTTVTAGIRVIQEDTQIIDIPLPKIHVGTGIVDVDALPSEDTFSMFAEALLALKQGVSDVYDVIEEASTAASNATTQAEYAKEQGDYAKQEAIEATTATAFANAAGEEATSAALSATGAATKATEAADKATASSEKADASAAKADASAKAADAITQQATEAEATRQSNEETRIAQESEREKAEAKRQETFETNEAKRQSNEDERISAEETRGQNETERIAQEDERKANESEREEKEAERERFANQLREDVEAGELNGATFTPTLAQNGDLSWENDKGLDNPDTVNIKGPKGDTGNGLMMLGSYSSLEALKEAHPSAERAGDAYIAGGHYYTWTGTEWADCGPLQGAKGADAVFASATATTDGTHKDAPTVETTLGGEPGAQTIAFAFSGLMGPKGDPGEPGKTGETGPQGPPGENATTTALASLAAPGLLRALSGNEDEVLLGSGEWGDYHGGGSGLGPMAFEVRSDGHLYVVYDDAFGEPNLSINDQGHLIWSYETQE